jgi:hypothetical protein
VIPNFLVKDLSWEVPVHLVIILKKAIGMEPSNELKGKVNSLGEKLL